MAYHRRTTMIALMLTLALGVLATTAAQPPGKSGSAASASPCSEVCSGGGYSGISNAARPTYSLPPTLNGVGDPGPCSEVCSGGGYSGISNAARPTYSLPPTLNGVGDPGPCSEVCSGGGYGS